MTDKIQVKLIIQGRVQGVFYRAHIQKAAKEIGVTGYVKNRPDGSVEAVFQGGQASVDKMIQWCWTGSPACAVSDVSVEKNPILSDFESFTITY
jgi:acylphosphatase